MNSRADATGRGATTARVFIVDDEPHSCDLMARMLGRLGLETVMFTVPAACLAAVEEGPPDLVIADLRMPEIDGLQVLKRVTEISPSTDVIIVTGDADKDMAIQALKLGAYDFFEKPVNPDEILATVKRALNHRAVRLERDRFAEQVSFLSNREAQEWGVEAFIGQSEPTRRILDDIRLLHRSGNTAVLITGESGTGKELVARAVHHGSNRSSRPFVPVNCCAVPGELWESVFFGHVRGAFTGATADKKGCFEVADRGTLFLDEIGDMPLHLQTKLLRVLEDGIVMPVGASKGHSVDVRVIASTNADIQKRVQEGMFRQDLYHRLAAFRIHIPPLRERREDIPILVAHFLRSFAHDMGMSAPPEMDQASLKLLLTCDYPGNVRELRNLVEQALIRCEGGTIEPAHLRLDSASRNAPLRTGEAPSAAGPIAAELPLNLQNAEAEIIRRAMKQTGGNVSRCARLLGIHRCKLYRKLACMGDAKP